MGTYLSVNKMNYFVSTKENHHKHILKDVSFYLKPGMMCLVLGSPGGGRSSLFKVTNKFAFIIQYLLLTTIKVLANVTPKGSNVEGSVLFNNQPINPSTHHRNISCIFYLPNEILIIYDYYEILLKMITTCQHSLLEKLCGSAQSVFFLLISTMLLKSTALMYHFIFIIYISYFLFLSIPSVLLPLISFRFC